MGVYCICIGHECEEEFNEECNQHGDYKENSCTEKVKEKHTQ